MAKVTPQQFAERWARRTSAAVPDYQAGISGVTVSPGIKAAENVAAYQAGIQQSIAEGKWQARVAAVPLAAWKSAAIDKGSGRIAAGVTQATPAMAQFAAELLPAIDAARDSLPARGNLDQNLERMVSFARKMSEFRRSP